ncbi:MAG: hypothetical protein KKF48_05300 [Nanoarchaeota archaeon]|nr:hypothetical protein [Nanoarchaeota archaeon]MBU1028435.1 hypothetical protein [Nanoarchaeota archaeon]
MSKYLSKNTRKTMIITTNKKTLVDTLKEVKNYLPKNVKETVLYGSALLTLLTPLLNTGCGVPPKEKIQNHRYFKEPKYSDQFGLNIKDLHNNPYVDSIKKTWGEDFQNPERAYHLAALDTAYRGLKNMLSPNKPNQEQIRLFQELLKSNVKDTTRINQIYDCLFASLSTNIEQPSQFRKSLEKNIQFGLENRDFHSIHETLRLGIGDLARYGYLVGGYSQNPDSSEITLSGIGGDWKEFTFDRLSHTKARGRICFTRNPTTGAYESGAPIDEDMPIYNSNEFVKEEMKLITDKVFIPDSTQALENVDIVSWATPLGPTTWAIRCDIYGDLEKILNKEDSTNCSITVALSDHNKTLSKVTIPKIVYSSKDKTSKKNTFHIGFDTKIYELDPNQTDSTEIFFGCEFQNIKTKQTARSVNAHTLFNARNIPIYSAKLCDKFQDDNQSKFNIANLAHNQKPKGKTAKIMIPVQAKSGEIDIYYSSKITKNKDPNVTIGDVIFSNSEDSIYVGKMNPKKDIFIKTIPFTNSGGIVQIEIPTDFKVSNKTTPKNYTLKAFVFNKDGNPVNIATIEDFIRK